MEVANGPFDPLQGLPIGSLGGEQRRRPGEHWAVVIQSPVIQVTYVQTRTQRCLRSPTLEEWSRFRVYAQRMTRLDASQDEGVPSDDILHLINLDRSSGEQFVPKLQHLTWTTSRTYLPWLHLLLSPSLSGIHIDLNGGRLAPVNVAVIKAIPTVRLRHIAFSTLRVNNEVDAALLGLVFKAKLLKSIYIQQENTVEGASLRTGEADGERDRIKLDYLTSIIMGFNNDAAFLHDFFGGTTLPNIQQVFLKHSGRAEWLGADKLFDCMLGSASPSALHSLRYISIHHGIDIVSAKIQPLQSYTALKTLRVTSSCNVSRCKFFLSDDDISTIALAMPNLVDLFLGGVPCNSALVNVSIDGLATLSANCTNLTELQIHFDTAGFINRALDTSGTHAAPAQLTQSSSRLTQLHVGRIPLSQGMDGYWTIGMALLRIFPKLKNIKSHQQLFGAGDWGEVMRVVEVQRNVTRLLKSASNPRPSI